MVSDTTGARETNVQLRDKEWDGQRKAQQLFDCSVPCKPKEQAGAALKESLAQAPAEVWASGEGVEAKEMLQGTGLNLHVGAWHVGQQT
jgi:hypothetical protein